MTRNTRKILFALTVTTALCVDQVAAAPTLRPQVAELAGRIVTRLTRGFRESVTVELPMHARRREAQPSRPALAKVASEGYVPQRALSPFEFRLPPPAI